MMWYRVKLRSSLRHGNLAIKENSDLAYFEVIRNPGHTRLRRFLWWLSYRLHSSKAMPVPSRSWSGWTAIRDLERAA